MSCTKKKFCRFLDERLNPEANHGKGLTVVLVFNMRTGGSRVAGVMYKTKEADRGLVLHYCPWCGTDLYKLFGVDKVKKAIEIDPPRESPSTRMKKFRAERNFLRGKA